MNSKAGYQGRNDSIYEPLPQGEFIRVLKLQPGKTTHDIECSLDVIDIETSKDSYEAISYVWGDPKHTVEVWCNGLRVSITVSLADALRNFRHASEPRLLWADALCINQKDDQEKGHQVKRMDQVYANAKCVLVWLGCDVNNVAQDTFALIREANAYFGDSFVKAGNSISRMEAFEEPYPISMNRGRWLGVVELLVFPWFKRVWTVQEVAVAAECRMFWGLASADIADILEISVWFRQSGGFFTAVEGIVGRIKYRKRRAIYLYFYYNAHRSVSWQRSRPGLIYFAKRNKEQYLCTVLSASRSLKATDPRDHVYAFLGCQVAKDGEGRTLVNADYTSSIHDLNLRLAFVLLNSPTEGPFVLSAARRGSRESLLDSNYPSWVPAWHVRGRDHTQLISPRYWYRASGFTKFFTTISPDDENFLTVGGFTFDKVVWTSNTIQYGTSLSYTHPSPMAPEPDELTIDTLCNRVIQNAAGLGHAIYQEDIFRTLMFDYPTQPSGRPVSHERQRKILEAYRKKTRVAHLSGAKAAGLTVGEREDASFFESKLKLLRGSELFLTENGCLGIVPLGELVEVGDACCIIFGATVPFLLTPGKDGRHKLVSECYIHGVMGGEIVQQFAGRDLSKQRIVLE